MQPDTWKQQTVRVVAVKEMRWNSQQLSRNMLLCRPRWIPVRGMPYNPPRTIVNGVRRQIQVVHNSIHSSLPGARPPTPRALSTRTLPCSLTLKISSVASFRDRIKECMASVCLAWSPPPPHTPLPALEIGLSWSRMHKSPRYRSLWGSAGLRRYWSISTRFSRFIYFLIACEAHWSGRSSFAVRMEFGSFLNYEHSNLKFLFWLLTELRWLNWLNWLSLQLGLLWQKLASRHCGLSMRSNIQMQTIV